MDYTPDIRKRIVLIPPKDIISVWEDDYSEMLTNMIYGKDKPTFETIIPPSLSQYFYPLGTLCRNKLFTLYNF